jgi:hypothetical protein
MMYQPGERVEGEFVQPSADMEEADARTLPILPLDHSIAADWALRATPIGVLLRLPPDFDPAATDEPDQAAFRGSDGAILAVTATEGVGEFVTFFASEDGVSPAAHEQGRYQIPLCGRTGKVTLSRIASAPHEMYFASASAAIADGRTILVLVMSSTAERRTELLNVIPTVTCDAAT